jgi:hypothetical protein
MAEYTYAKVSDVHALFGQTYGSECEGCCMYQEHFCVVGFQSEKRFLLVLDDLRKMAHMMYSK